MNSLTRWDPFREMMDVRRMMDRLAETDFFTQEGQQLTFGMPLDVSESPDAYQIDAAMPGVNPDEIEITVDNNTLTIRGEVKEEHEEEDKTYHVRERRYGTFTRSIVLPQNVKADDIEANYDNGVLHLRLPKAEGAKTKHIQVQKGPQSKKSTKVIEGHSKGAGK